MANKSKEAERQNKALQSILEGKPVEKDYVLVRRSNFISEFEGGGISTIVTNAELLDVIGGKLVDGRFVQSGLSDIPVTVLGSVTAERLGIYNLSKPTKILIENEWFGVIGILEELKIHPDLDRSVFIGYGIAESLFGITGEPTTIYVRANPTDMTITFAIATPPTSKATDPNPNNRLVKASSAACCASSASDGRVTST